MIRNFKALGLALVAICAFGVMGASAANARVLHMTTPGNDSADIVGHDIGVVKFTVTGQEVFCETAEYSGASTAEEFTTLTVTPKYTNCKAKIFGSTINATVTGFGAGGCDFLLHSSGISDLKCATGKDVTVTAGTCVVHIPAQDGLGTVEYDTDVSDVTGKEDLTLTLDVIEITENHTDGFLCPLSGSGHTTTGVLEGEITATALVDGNPVDLTDHTTP